MSTEYYENTRKLYWRESHFINYNYFGIEYVQTFGLTKVQVFKIWFYDKDNKKH